MFSDPFKGPPPQRARTTPPRVTQDPLPQNDSPSACGAGDLYVAGIFDGVLIGSRLSEGRPAEELCFVPPGYEDLAK